MFTALTSAVDSVLVTRTTDKGPESVSLIDAPFSRALFLDVEGPDTAGAYALTLRGEDKHKVGSAKDVTDAAQVWNDETGAPRTVVLVTSDTRERVEVCAEQLLDFYGPPTEENGPQTFAQRYEALGADARAVLPVLLATFGGQRMARNGWKVGSYAAYVADRAAGASKRAAKVAKQAAASGAVAAAAARVASADSMADLIDPATGQIDPAKLQAKLTAAFAALAAA